MKNNPSSRIADQMQQVNENIAHQLRTPLTILQGEIETTLAYDRSVEEYKQILQSNLEEVKRTVKAIEKLLLLGKLKSNLYFVQKEVIDISALVISILKKFEKRIKEKELQYSFTALHQKDLQIDSFLFENLFYNLIDNAIKYAVSQTTIEIKLSLEEKWFVIVVSNVIAGPIVGEVDKMFDRYTSNSRLSGLGLSIVDEIVKNYQGEIKASLADNNIIEFLVKLPL